VSRKEQTYIILILGGLSTVSPFAIDMYLPGFPAIASDFNTSIANVQLSLTSYFIGIAAGQLLYGPLLDRYGRKIPLYAGLAVYILASFGCAFTESVEMLIGMRLLQALGGCAGMVAAQTLVRDLFPVNRIAQAFSWITLVIAVSPMIAPTVGGILTERFGWESVFITLGVVSSVIMILVYFILPEGRKADKTLSLKPKPVLKNFIAVTRDRQFLTYCIAGGLASSATFAFISGSSDVFINLYHATPQEFGWIFAIAGGTIIGCTQLNHLLLKRFRSEQIVFSALLYQLIVGAALVAGTLAGWYDKYSFLAIIVLFLAAHGLGNANTVALSLAPFTKNTGSAASLVGTIRMAMGAVVSGVVSLLHNGTAIPMVLIMAFCVAGGFILLVAFRRSIPLEPAESISDETPVIM
jgi:MFS transporter, DHA1 family, multidrug resistance protein